MKKLLIGLLAVATISAFAGIKNASILPNTQVGTPFEQIKTSFENAKNTFDLDWFISHHYVDDKTGDFDVRGGNAKIILSTCFMESAPYTPRESQLYIGKIVAGDENFKQTLYMLLSFDRTYDTPWVREAAESLSLIRINSAKKNNSLEVTLTIKTLDDFTYKLVSDADNFYYAIYEKDTKPFAVCYFKNKQFGI